MTRLERVLALCDRFYGPVLLATLVAGFTLVLLMATVR